MKTKFLLIPLLSIAFLITKAQTTVSFKINSNDEDAQISTYEPSTNFGNEVEYFSGAWTISGASTIWRNFFKFNMCIPPNAIVQSAYLSLYYAPINSFGNVQHSSLTSSNESVIQRVTSPWTENTVTWNNQPSTTSSDQVILPQSSSGTQDYTNLNVTAMVQQMVSNSNYGFILKLTNEVEYARMIFASGDNVDSSKHPLLVITYTVPSTGCITIRIDSNDEDAQISTYEPSTNFGNEIEYFSGAWTISGASTVWRNFFKFNLPCILYNATVQSAHLSLYYAPINSFGNVQHSSLTSSNESVLQRVTSPWTENTVTWNNQPSTTSSDQVILPQSSSGTQDYTNIDVTAMVQQMVNNSNYGFILKLTNEVEYARMIFASGDNSDTSKHPKLVICYTVSTSINELTQNNNLLIYPNPFTSSSTLQLNTQLKDAEVVIYDILGKEMLRKKLTGDRMEIEKGSLESGVYFVMVRSEEREWVEKVVVE